MNKVFMETTSPETEQMKQKEEVSYEHAGYQVRVHFNGNKTLVQCLKNLMEQRVE